MNELYTWIKPESVAAIFLIMGRVSGIFLTAPLFSNKALPARVKIALIVMISLILFPMVKLDSTLDLKQSDLSLLSSILVELTVGLILGFSAYLVFASVQTLGELLGMQAGLGFASLVDPANEGSSGLITTFYVILGALIFLSMDAHHLILGGLVRSFSMAPLGHGWQVTTAHGLLGLMAKTFAVAVQMAVPILVVNTVVSVIFGFMTKLSPSMGIYFNLGFIVMPAIGVIVLMASIPLFRVLFMQLTEGLEPEMIQLLKQMKGT